MNGDAVASLWEAQPLATWRALWQIPELHVFQRIGSTNDVARDLAIAGAPAGTIVIAELQTAGRGRFGRRWIAPPASSLMLSCVLRPEPHADAAPGTLPLRIGLAAADAIDTVTRVRVGLKWPNDLVVPGAGKVGGILCEALTTGATWSVIAGIGINVRQQPDDWPPELRSHATSLDAQSHAIVDRAALAGALVQRLRPMFTAPLQTFGSAELHDYAARDVLAGQNVIVENASRGDDASAPRYSGVCIGVAPDGALRLRTGNETVRITTGTVRIAESRTERSAARTTP